MKDYYQILGVERGANDEEIKRAYRRLASQHHPDKGGDKAQFQEVQEAYATLSDPQRRSQYDNPMRGAHFGMGGMPGGFNIDEIFNMFGVNMRQQRSSPRISLWIGLEDVARGGPKMISLQVGDRVSNVQIDVPPGINDGDTIRYPKLSPDGQDLIITYRIKPHPVWQREGRNITMEQQVDLWDLILGCEITVTDLTNSTLVINVPAGTQPGSLLRARGRGLPPSSIPGHSGGPLGDLFVRVQTRIPDRISEDLMAAIRSERGH